MKLNIRTIHGIQKVEVIGTPFSIGIAPGYKFFSWETEEGTNDGEISEFQTGMSMGIRNEYEHELIEMIEKRGFKNFVTRVKKLIKEHGVINK